MNQPASFNLRLLYILAILSIVVPLGMSAWTVTSRNESPFQMVSYGFSFAFLLLGIWRVYQVVRHPGTLESFVYGGMSKFLRIVGIVCMSVGVLYLFLRFSYRPIIQALVERPSGSGAEFFVVGVYLAMLGGFGSLGIILFEFSRLIGFERAIRGRS